MPDKKEKYVVVHPKLNLAVEGKLQRVPVGTELELTKAQDEAFGPHKVKPAAEAKKLKIGEEKTDEKAKPSK